MDAVMFLWDFAPAWKTKLLFLAMVGQVAIAIYAYTKMSKARVAAGRAKRITADDYKATKDEPEDLRVLTRAVANQFEMPVLFYVLVLASVTVSAHSWITVVLAWFYVVLRIVHMREMISDNRVLRRRKVFIHSARILLLMLVEFVIVLLFVVKV